MISTDNVPAGVAMLFDASDYASFTIASGAVSQWNDKSGNARHLAQSTAGYRPTVDAGGVLFDGTDDYLIWTVSGSFYNAIAGATMVVIAAGKQTPTGNGILAVTTNAGTAARHGIRFWNTSVNNITFQARSDDAGSTALVTASNRHHKGMIRSLVNRTAYSAGTMYASIGGGAETSAAVSPTQNTNATNALKVVVGANPSPVSGFLTGYVYAVAVWQTLLPAEQAYNAAYIMGANFGYTPAPASTTYALTAPSHVTMQAGSSLTFAVSGGSSPYYAGWRVKPTNCAASVSGSDITIASTGAAPGGGELIVTNTVGNVARVKVSITT